MAEDVEAVESVVVEGGDGDVEVVDVVVGEEVEALSLVNAGRDRRTELKRKSPEEEDEEASCIQQAKKASVEGDSGREDDDDGAVCNICMEAWTNSGEHRIASLKCGHFFGHSCIDRWLRNGGSSCPNCNERGSRRDIRAHYIARLQAIDTSERDRALADLEKARRAHRTLELEHTALKVTLGMQAREIERLAEEVRRARAGATDLTTAVASSQQPSSSKSSTFLSLSCGGDRLRQHQHRLKYVRRIELVRGEAVAAATDRDKYCRVMCYNEFHGMLVVSQPSFTALAPGFGVRKINMVEQKADAFVSLHKDPIRDLAFSPGRPDQLLSVSQDRTAKLTNVSTNQVMQKYSLDNDEPWCCCWSWSDDNVFFVGTKRGRVMAFDTRLSGELSRRIELPDNRLPVIALCHVPKVRTQGEGAAASSSCPSGGILVQTLNSVWFLEETRGDRREEGEGEEGGQQYRPHRLSLDGPFWSMRLDRETRLFLISTRPRPHSRHLVCELGQQQMATGEGQSNSICANVLFSEHRGGAYAERSFLRSAMVRHPDNESQLVLLYAKGSGLTDQRVSVQELGSSRPLQECSVPRPVLDVLAPVDVNGTSFVAFLCETEVLLYKWDRI